MSNIPKPNSPKIDAIIDLVLEHKGFELETRSRIAELLKVDPRIAEWEQQNERESKKETQTENKNEIEKDLQGILSSIIEEL